jgi:hypothetical protein
LFCCLPLCRLSFFPYVIKLALKTGQVSGGAVGQEIEKEHTRSYRYETACWTIEPVSLRSSQALRHLR